jgi:hypothetical protein
MGSAIGGNGAPHVIPQWPNADRWKLVKKLRLIRVEYREKASIAKNQGFSTC